MNGDELLGLVYDAIQKAIRSTDMIRLWFQSSMYLACKCQSVSPDKQEIEREKPVDLPEQREKILTHNAGSRRKYLTTSRLTC